MRVFLVVLLVFLSETSCDEPEFSVSQSNGHFSGQLYGKLSSTEGNILVSPLSAQTLLTIAYLGAGGTTARELEDGLGILPNSTGSIAPAFRHLMENLNSTDKITLDIANRLYLQEGFLINDTFEQTLVSDFKAGIQQVDFASDTEGARTNINQWVEEKTHGKIQDLIAEESLSNSTLLVAVNALYFKGGWLKPFKEKNTFTAPFHVSTNETVDVDMMHIKDRFWYARDSDVGVQSVLLKYRGPEDHPYRESETISMAIILPDEETPLSRVESLVAEGNLTQLLQPKRYKKVHLSLPRFKIGATIDLKDVLQQIGINKLFKPGADLSGITEENIYVGKILQKTIVEVTEKGTEAAAATFLEGVGRALVLPVNFTVNRPFLFAILEERQNVILFLGRVLNPQ